MGKTLDQDSALQPFIFQSLDDPFGNSDATVLADCTKPLEYPKLPHKLPESKATENRLLIGYQMLGRSEPFDGFIECLTNPSSVSPFQWLHRYDLPREMINHYTPKPCGGTASRKTNVGQRPQRRTVVRSADQTWFG